MSILEVSNLKKVYVTRFGGNKVEALTDVNFTVEQGEYVAIMGESGSGKSTLLNILAALDKPTAGKVILDGKDLSSIKDSALAEFRRNELGFVFQDFNLLDTFTLEDNIYLPLVLAGKNYNEMKKRLEPIAQRLGISSLLNKYPYEVSGGQKQRAAVARAMIINPKLIDDAELLKQNNPTAYANEYLGEETGDGGNVFENVELREITDEEIANFDYLYQGMDFGWFPDPLAWTKMCYQPNKLTLYIFDEYVVNKMSNQKVWNCLKENKCVVKEKVNDGIILKSRYDNYVKMVDEVESKRIIYKK